MTCQMTLSQADLPAVILARRVSGGLVRRLSCPPSLWRSGGVAEWRSGGLEGLSAVFLAGLSAVFLAGWPEFFGEEVIDSRIKI